MSNAYKTAIKRTRPSAPMAHLAEKDLLQGRVLDYGCGRGFDAEHFKLEKYDPHFAPDRPTGKFDVVVCNFVLNVIESADERAAVLADIHDLLDGGGDAFITVRNDKKELNGKTRIGTWQGLIKLDLPVIKRGAGYTIYHMRRG